ncbi:MAG: hypothetical protein IKX88_15925 [Thermoguttaceae bacterium]|nr:hypothetical protein [Thermoguttaceae bacterium]
MSAKRFTYPELRISRPMFTFVDKITVRLTRRDSAPDVARVRLTATALVAALLAAFSIFLPAGCSSAPKVQLPKVIGSNPSFSEFIGVVNKNTAKINSVHFPNARVGVATQYGTANCTISYDKPNKFRMVGVSSSLGGRFIDLGCTGSTFWYWTKDDDANSVYTCDLDKFVGSELSRLLPLDPTWFPEALGIVTINEEDLLEAPTDNKDGTFRTKVKRTRPDGVYTEYIYFKPETAAIVRQDVQDPRGRTIVSVRCQNHQYLKDLDLVLPDSLIVDCIDADMKLDFSLREPIVNDSSKLLSFEIPTDSARQVDMSKKPDADVAVNSGAQSVVAAPVTSPSPSAEEQTPGGLNGPDAVDASKYRRPLPDTPTYSAPVESGAGIVPFPTPVAADGAPRLAAQNVGGQSAQSYLVVPETAAPPQNSVQPIATASATVELPASQNYASQNVGASFEEPDLSQTNAFVPQTSFYAQNQAQAPATGLVAQGISESSLPVDAQEARRQQAQYRQTQYQQAQYQQAQVQGAVNQSPVYPDVAPVNAAPTTAASPSYSAQSWNASASPTAPYQPSQYPASQQTLSPAPVATPTQSINSGASALQPPVANPGATFDDPAPTLAAPTLDPPTEAPTLDFPDVVY